VPLGGFPSFNCHLDAPLGVPDGQSWATDLICASGILSLPLAAFASCLLRAYVLMGCCSLQEPESLPWSWPRDVLLCGLTLFGWQLALLSIQTGPRECRSPVALTLRCRQIYFCNSYLELGAGAWECRERLVCPHPTPDSPQPVPHVLLLFSDHWCRWRDGNRKHAS
jgi:hypothetical protein